MLEEIKGRAQKEQLMRLIKMLDGRLDEPVEDMERDVEREGGKAEGADLRDVAEHIEAPLTDEHAAEDEEEETESMHKRNEESMEDLGEDEERDEDDEDRDRAESMQDLVTAFMNGGASEGPRRAKMMSMDPAATVSKTSVSLGDAGPMGKKKRRKR